MGFHRPLIRLRRFVLIGHRLFSVLPDSYNDGRPFGVACIQVPATNVGQTLPGGFDIMATADRLNGTVRASLCEIERGLFHASYRAGAPGPWAMPAARLQHLPVYQVARCAAEARQIIERNALAIGFDGIDWDEDVPVPATPPGADERGRLHHGAAARSH
jgi:hypothetical protein